MSMKSARENRDAFAIRPEDFRKSWPTALAIASQEFFEAVQVLESTTGAIYELAAKTPKMLQAADERMERSTQKAVAVLESIQCDVALSHGELVKAQQEFLRTFAVERAEIEKARIHAQMLLSQVKSQKAEFEKLGFFGRMFYKPKPGR